MKLPERRPGVPEVLQDLAHDQNIEVRLREWKLDRFDVSSDDMVHLAGRLFSRLGKQLHARGPAALAGFSCIPGGISRTAADFEQVGVRIRRKVVREPLPRSGEIAHGLV